MEQKPADAVFVAVDMQSSVRISKDALVHHEEPVKPSGLIAWNLLFQHGERITRGKAIINTNVPIVKA